MSQPGKVDLSMFEGPPAAPLYRSAQPAVQQNPFAPAQPAAQPNPFTQPAAAADPFSPPPAPAPADPFSPPPAAPDPFSPPPNGFRGASAAPIADNPFAPAAPAAPVDNPFFGGPSDDAAGGSDSLLGALDPDAAQPEESLTVGEIETQIAPGEKEEDEDKTLVLSRQDTFHYLAQLGEGSRDEKLAAARALKFLAFNATPEYKSGLIEAGLFRMLLQIMDDSGTAAEHAASCMYSMAREHQPSKLELLCVAAHRKLVEKLRSNAASKQLQLNACAALYAISCAGKPHVAKVVAEVELRDLTPLLNPPSAGREERTAQDEQMQLFAALFVVNLLHAKVKMEAYEAQSLLEGLGRAHDEAGEAQARDIINLGIKKLQKRLAKGGGGGKVPTSSLKRLSLSRGTSRKFDSSSYNTGSSTHSDGANPPSYGGEAFGGGGAEEVSPAPHFQKRKSGLFRKR